MESKMIHSMTGYGKGECKYRGRAISVEIRALNHRYFDLSSRLPETLLFLEEKIRDHIHKRIRRGRVNLNITFEKEEAAETLSLDEKLAKRYYELLKRLSGKLHLRDDIEAAQIVAFPEVITCQPKERDLKQIWHSLKRALDDALKVLIEGRAREGKFLYKDFVGRALTIQRQLEKIRRRAPVVVSSYKGRLEERLKELTAGTRLDRSRLETEAAIFAKSCDVTEEITRLSSHLAAFKETLLSKKEVGRKLDFIAQELFREANTVGAKASDYKVSQWVIQIKEEVDKIREQVQNVE